MSKDNISNNSLKAERAIGKPTLPDFDTLRDLARHDPEGLEKLRVALCSKVIEEAPVHAQPRLEGLMFQINARRKLATSNLEACENISELMNDSLQRMQAMLKDLRTVQSESILLSTNRNSTPEKTDGTRISTATIIPFNR